MSLAASKRVNSSNGSFIRTEWHFYTKRRKRNSTKGRWLLYMSAAALDKRDQGLVTLPDHNLEAALCLHTTP